jgi:hypothetical protein
MRAAALALLALLACSAAVPAAAQADSEKLRSAKALFFDRKYAEARQAWLSIQAGATGSDADAAAYWVARCSESLGENTRALAEYGAYLERRGKDPTLAEEAKTSRVGLAARLYRGGHRQHLPILRKALSDPSKTVQYYAAFQLADLGPEVAQPAVPVLKRIVEQERDADLVDRATLKLLRLDPQALSPRTSAGPTSGPASSGPTRAGPTHAPRGGAVREATWLKIRIHQEGKAAPVVSVNLPVGLADLVFDSLPDDARAELRKEGFDAENFWKRLRKLGPAEIVEIKGEDGELIKIWLE